MIRKIDQGEIFIGGVTPAKANLGIEMSTEEAVERVIQKIMGREDLCFLRLGLVEEVSREEVLILIHEDFQEEDHLIVHPEKEDKSSLRTEKLIGFILLEYTWFPKASFVQRVYPLISSGNLAINKE